MDDGGLNSALDRAEQALHRIERALASRRPAAPARDEALRTKVREAVAELDQLIREADPLMAAMVDLTIAGRTYQVACREGEEESLQTARMVDAKSREALSGLGTLSEARQFLFASLLLADQLMDKDPSAAPAVAVPDSALVARAELLAGRLETLAEALEREGASA